MSDTEMEMFKTVINALLIKHGADSMISDKRLVKRAMQIVKAIMVRVNKK